MKVFYYLKRAVTLPPHVVLGKAIRKARQIIKEKKLRFADERYTTYETRNVGDLHQFFRAIDPDNLPKEQIRALNSRFLNHEFDLLGSGTVRVFHGMQCNGIEGIVYPPASPSEINRNNQQISANVRSCISEKYVPIDWHIDFKSGFRWRESTWSPNIEYGSNAGADVKVPWELARMQHLSMLGWGYALDRDQKYVVEFQDQILDFIASNPPRYGVNWVCTMDVGIRVANWLMAYDIFSAYGAKFEEEFLAVLARGVYEHGKHIFNHLEWDPYLRSNHYLANIAGLLFAAAYLPQDAEVQSWLVFAIDELKKEVMSQFHSDGSNFEASSSYHRLSAEMVVFATALALEIGTRFSDEYMTRLQKMADFIRDITKPDGSIVQCGDNDSGRFMKIFPDEDVLDHRYLVQSIRNGNDLTSVIQAQLSQMKEAGKKKTAYPDFGLYIYRNQGLFMAARCGSIGQKGNGGHAHNDQLSFELAVNGISMIIDPGTYIYTALPDARRLFRSTAMHNTVAAVGLEQNIDEGLFRMKDRAHGNVILSDENTFIGEHQGFGWIHRRTLKMERDRLVGIDECGSGLKEIWFHFAPGWDVSSDLCTYKHVKVQFRSSCSFRTEDGKISRAYGHMEKAKKIVVRTTEKRVEWCLAVVGVTNHVGGHFD